MMWVIRSTIDGANESFDAIADFDPPEDPALISFDPLTSLSGTTEVPNYNAVR